MNGFVFLDYLLVAAAVAGSWKLFHTAQPPPAGAKVKQQGLFLPPAPAEAASQSPRSVDVQTSLNDTLKRICVASGYASIENFLDGAKHAYEEVIKGFASGELMPVTHLLSRSVYEDFALAIAERDERGESEELMFIGFRAAEVTGAGIARGCAWIEVRFAGDLISVTRDREGRCIAGHPAKIVSVAELWTFERELRSSQPHWVLTATEPDE